MKYKNKIFFGLIIILAIFLRFYNLNWDQNAHIHPDERFLTMVGGAIKLPGSFSEYLDPNISTFNPANIGYRFFVYGLFPLTLNKLLAVALSNDTYNGFTIQGRFLSAFADLFVVILIFKIVYLLEKKYQLDQSIKFFSSFLYSIFVLPIQLSHFFVVDSFLNLFALASFYFGLNYWIKKKTIFVAIAGILFGLALASKITAIFILLLIIPFLLVLRKNHKIKSFQLSLLNILIFILISYFVLRITNPYIFDSGNFLTIKTNPLFIENIKTLKTLSSKDSFFPPNVQWINKIPLLYVFKNLIIFGIGIPAFIAFIFGIFGSLKTRAKPIVLGILIWMFSFFLYQGSQTAVPMRYFILAYPFIAIIGAFGIYYIFKRFGKVSQTITLILITLWGLMFFSIYTKPHSRVKATNWIIQNIPQGNVILSEHWDDALPLTNGGNYKILQLPVFDQDTNEKWTIMEQLLNQGNYLILSSNRGWGSIPTVPERYPKMTSFYENLFQNKLAYKKIKEFTSYPSLEYLGIPITFPDDWADENFTVFDHPKVMIFKKMK